MPKFRAGEKVEWTSQAGGYTKTKTGVILVVVPAGVCPKKHANSLELVNVLPPQYPGCPRDHETYLVQLGRRTRLYWPLVRNLKSLEAPF